MRRRFATQWVTAAFAVVLCSNISAASSDQVIEDLMAQVKALTARLEAVESAQQISAVAEHTYKVSKATVSSAAAVAFVAKASLKPAWTDNIKMKGDFRYRHEAFDVENNRDRHRQRVRARTVIQAKVSDQLSAGFGLATGGSDPISTNQSFDDASSSKGVVIDLAYISWKTPVQGLNIHAGKFKNPFHRAGGNGLIWDADLNPEGVALKYSQGKVFATAIASWVDESSSDDDSFLIGGQFGLGHTLGEDGSLLAGVSYFNYIDAIGELAFFDGASKGNRLNANGEYINGFELLEGFVEYSIEINDLELTVFGDYVQNLEANGYDSGYAMGTKIKGSTWQVGYTYQDLEADAVLGTYTDSDFIGGGTDGRGHRLQASYSLSKSIGLTGTLFLNERNIDFGSEQDYKRLMLDISFKY